MKKHIVLALAATAGIAVSGAASAAALVTVTEGGVIVASWQQSLTPTPIGYDAKSTDVSVFNPVGLGGDTDVFWYPTSNGGGLSAYLGDLNIVGLPAEFSGSTSAPIFAYGTFTGFDYGAQIPRNVPAIIKIAPVPEPATWATMLAGLGMIGFAARRRRNVRIVYG